MTTSKFKSLWAGFILILIYSIIGSAIHFVIKGGNFYSWIFYNDLEEAWRLIATISVLFCTGTFSHYLILKQNESRQSLKKSEEKCRLLFENSSVGLGLFEENGKVISCNKALRDIMGINSLNSSHLKYDDIFVDENDRIFIKEEIRKHGKVRNYELKLRREDGSEYIALINIDLVKLNHETVFLVTVQDITRRKKAEDELKESEKKFKQFFESQPEYCYMVSLDGRIIDVNKSALEVLGYDKEELIGRHIKDIYAPESHSKMESNLKKWRKTGFLKNEEMVIITKNGERRNVLLSASAVTDGEGNIIHSVSVQRDITELKKIQFALSESERKYRDVVENIHEGIVIIQDGIPKFANKMACDLLGYTEDELTSTPFLNFVYPDDRANVKELLSKIERNRVVNNSDFRIVNKNRDILWLRNNGVLIEWNGGIATLVFFTDITDKKESEEKLQRELKVNTAFAELSDKLLDKSTTVEEISKLVLEQAELITNSQLGIVLVMDPENGDNIGYAISGMTELEPAHYNGVGELIETVSFSKEKDNSRWYGGLLGISLNSEEAFYTNSPPALREYEFPNNYIEIENLLSVPAFDDGKLIGQISLANKEDGYDEDDLNVIKRLANLFALAIQRRTAEKSLKVSEERYRTTFEHTGSAMALVDGNLTINLVNSEFEKLTGYGKEEIQNKMNWSQLLREEEFKILTEYYALVKTESKGPLEFEINIQGKEGNTRNVLVTIASVPESNQYITSLTDITYIKRLNKLLEVISEINELVAKDKSPEKVLGVLCEKLTTVYDAAFTALGNNLPELKPVNSKGIDLNSIKKVIGNCRPINKALKGEFCELSEDEKVCKCCTASPYKHSLTVPLKHGKVYGIILIHSNSKFKREEKELIKKLSDNIAFALNAYEVEKEKVAAMEQLATNLTHFDKSADRLRNPLAVIMTSMELMDIYGKDKVLEIISEQSRRIKRELDELRKEEINTYNLVKPTLEEKITDKGKFN